MEAKILEVVSIQMDSIFAAGDVGFVDSVLSSDEDLEGYEVCSMTEYWLVATVVVLTGARPIGLHQNFSNRYPAG